MAGVKSVRLAIQVATVRRDQAAAMLLQMQQSQSLAQEQMSQLQTYAEETEARWVKAAQISVTDVELSVFAQGLTHGRSRLA